MDTTSGLRGPRPDDRGAAPERLRFGPAGDLPTGISAHGADDPSAAGRPQDRIRVETKARDEPRARLTWGATAGVETPSSRWNGPDWHRSPIGRLWPPPAFFWPPGLAPNRSHLAGAQGTRTRDRGRRNPAGDRKSTRLNSSHQ